MHKLCVVKISKSALERRAEEVNVMNYHAIAGIGDGGQGTCSYFASSTTFNLCLRRFTRLVLSPIAEFCEQEMCEHPILSI